MKTMLKTIIAACLFVMADLALSNGGIWAKPALMAIDLALTMAVVAPVFILSQARWRWCQWLAYALGAALIAIYGLSWAVSKDVGVFLDVQGIQMFLGNAGQVSMHILQASPRKLALVLMLGILVPALAPFLVSRAVGAIAQAIDRNGRIRKAVLMAGVALAGAGIAAIVGCKDMTVVRLLRDGLSPQATLACDLLTPLQPQTLTVEGDGGLRFTWHRQAPLKAPGIGKIDKAPVIMIVIESFRNDMLDDAAVMPNLYALKEDALYWRSSLTPGNSTDYAWPSTLSSLYPLRSLRHHIYPEPVPYPRVFIYDVLKRYGYKTAIFSAQNEEWYGMGRYLGTGSLDVLYHAAVEKSGHYVHDKDAWLKQWIGKVHAAGKIDDGVVMGRAMDWLKSAGTKGIFLAVNMQRTHFPYTWPDGFAPKYLPVDLDFDFQFTKYPPAKVPVMKNRYKNALGYVDLQIGRLVAFLKEAGLYEQSLIIVTGDHGESFYEKDTSGHAASLHNAEMFVPLVIKMPGAAMKGDRATIVQNIDIAPTICHVLGIPTHPSFQGDDLLGDLPRDRPLFSIVQSSLADGAMVVSDGWVLTQDYRDRRESLFNLSQDPQGKVDLLWDERKTAGRLRAQIAAWRKAQLMYYADPKTFTEFYPPRVSADPGGP